MGNLLTLGGHAPQLTAAEQARLSPLATTPSGVVDPARRLRLARAVRRMQRA